MAKDNFYLPERSGGKGPTKEGQKRPHIRKIEVPIVIKTGVECVTGVR